MIKAEMFNTNRGTCKNVPTGFVFLV